MGDAEMYKDFEDKIALFNALYTIKSHCEKYDNCKDCILSYRTHTSVGCYINESNVPGNIDLALMKKKLFEGGK